MHQRSPGGRRILMYSHDTFGLGHLTRTLRIAEAVQKRHEHTSILVLSGLPVAPYLPLPPRTDLVKLPSVLKSGPERYRSRDLEVGFKQIRAIRRGVIRSTAETFQPHIFLVDNVPLGMKGEIVPTLELLEGRAHIVLNLRDILDDGGAIRRRWASDGVPAVLDRFYDAIHVFGDEKIYDSVSAYGLPSGKTRQLGYVTPGNRFQHEAFDPSPNRARRVLVTAGGGGDGLPLLRATLDSVADLRRRVPFPVDLEIVTGPLMEDGARMELLESAGRNGCQVSEFVRDLPTRMESSDLVLAMAGYNTCCEILSRARAALLYPREVPRLEQRIRADAFAAHGLARALPPGPPEPREIARAAAEMLEREEVLDEASLPLTGGQDRAAAALDVWLGAGNGSLRREPGSTPGDSAQPPQAFFAVGRRDHPPGEAGITGRVPGLDHAKKVLEDPMGFVPFWPGSLAV